MAKKALLMILDGWGIGSHGKGDVIFQTPTPFMDSLNAKYPHSELLASGENVGLPDGQMGNSEVGHLNIGAGRIVYQRSAMNPLRLRICQEKRQRPSLDGLDFNGRCTLFARPPLQTR